MAAQRKVARARNRRLVGSEVTVLVEGLSPETDLLWEGRMPTQAPEIDGVTFINDFEGAEPKSGEMRRLRVTEAHDYDVVGTLLPGAAEMLPAAAEPFPLLRIKLHPSPQVPSPAV
jgi:ribosomal protein S12 methylthiotransferase